jgi:hypothetical protein
VIEWILQELEKQPSRLFYAQELNVTDAMEFTRLKSEKALAYVQPDEFNETYGFDQPVPLTVARIGSQYWGISEDDPESDPVLLNRSDLGRYKFMVDHFATKLRMANDLSGSPFSLDGREFFLGERMVDHKRIAFVFGLYNSDHLSQNLLLSLRGKLARKFDYIIVVTPSYVVTSVLLAAQCERMQIYVVPLKATQNFAVDIAALVKTGRSLTAEQEKDYEVYRYKCRLPVHATGEITGHGNYLVCVGETFVEIGEVPFRLFLRLLLELKQNKTGMVSKVKLKAEGYLSEDSEFQSVGRLRDCFARALGDLDPKEFIEAVQPKTLRLSVHPDLVSWNLEKLLSQNDPRICQFANQLAIVGLTVNTVN